MGKNYEMVTVASYIDELNGYKCDTVNEIEIRNEVEKYLQAENNKNKNAQLIESLLA